MAKRRNNRKRRVFILAVSLLITTVMFATSSYAWFTANKEVKVERLSVNVEAKNGIQISANAVDWKSYIQKNDIWGATAKYGDAVNQIPSTMEPVSTAGNISDDGRLELFYGTVTNDRNTGNAYLTAQQEEDAVTSSTNMVGKYVAFDLFFKVTKQSRLYLEPGSGVSPVIPDGAPENYNGTGIQNAARVGFVILGNAPSSTAYETLQALGTTAAESKSLYLWEPNYNKHTGAAVQHAYATYNIQTQETDSSALKYQGVKAEIGSSDNVLVQTDMTDEESDYVATYPTKFGDITPNKTTVASFSDEEQIFTLQPGVTKVRIYKEHYPDMVNKGLYKDDKEA